MKRIALWVLASSISLVAQTPQTSLPPVANTKVDYEKDVKPILAQNCYSCHGDAVQQSGLRLDLRQNALRGGDYGPVIIPGKSAESKLIKRVVDGDGAMQMPPSGPLSPEDIGILRAWIDQGVEFRTTIAEVPTKAHRSQDCRADYGGPHPAGRCNRNADWARSRHGHGGRSGRFDAASSCRGFRQP